MPTEWLEFLLLLPVSHEIFEFRVLMGLRYL